MLLLNCFIVTPAYDNLNIKCKLTGIKKKGYIEELLKTVGLDTVGEKKTKHYSLGMKQRLGIALALVGEPDLLILDEPINGLDPQGIVDRTLLAAAALATIVRLPAQEAKRTLSLDGRTTYLTD